MGGGDHTSNSDVCRIMYVFDLGVVYKLFGVIPETLSTVGGGHHIRRRVARACTVQHLLAVYSSEYICFLCAMLLL